MNRNGHLAAATLSAVLVSAHLDQPLWQRVLSPVVALSTAMAPDVDNSRWWQQIRKRVPVPAIRRAMNHRRIMHAWPLPVLALLSQSSPGWVFIALVVGYASHLVADGLFGEPGVPVIGWGWMLGLQLPMGGRLESTATVMMTVYGLASIPFGPAVVLHAMAMLSSWVFTAISLALGAVLLVAGAFGALLTPW